MFNLPPGGIGTATNGTVSIRAKAVAASGEENTKELGVYQILRQHTGGNRYGGRDETEGGDDWVKPSVDDLIGGYNLTWGDFSNMNGGRFAPHASHRTGNDIDGWFNGYNNRDAATAASIIGHLNAANGGRITAVFVTFTRQQGDAFWGAIENVVLGDGRRARDVILPVGGHTRHFHWRVGDN